MMEKNMKFILTIIVLLQSLFSLRSSSKVSVSVQSILEKQSASLGRASAGRSLSQVAYPELPQANPPSEQNFARPILQSHQMGDNNVKPNSDIWTLRKLKRILGQDFDPEWMSIVQPPKVPSSSFPWGYPKPNIDLIKSIDQLNFNLTNSYSSAIQPEYISLFKNWLLTKSTCQIEFQWEDLGEHYWPKFIRRGVCKSSASSCSWPPGMRCKLGGGKSITILRWKCDQQGKEDQEEIRRRRDNDRWDSFQRRKRQDMNYQERRQIRLKRLIRQLSVTKNGFHCQWTRHEQIINDECICGCN